MQAVQERYSRDDSYMDQIIEDTTRAILRGQSILYPSDTIWGIGCDIRNESAIRYVKSIKEVPDGFPMVLIVNSIMMLKQYIRYIHPRIETLLLYHHQPLTFIYDSNENISTSLMTSDKRIAIRVSHDDFCNQIIFRLDRPLLSTSAAVGKGKIPRNYDAISADIKTKIDFIVQIWQQIETHRQPSIIATFNEKGDLTQLGPTRAVGQ